MFDPQPVFPGREVRFVGVPEGGVGGEASCDEDVGAVSEQLQGDLIADLQPPAGDDRSPSGQVCPLVALLLVEPGAGWAELVIVGVNLSVTALADVAAAGLRFQ